MKSFSVHFHEEDSLDQILVEKLSEEDFEKAIAGGARQLFELDTNFGLFLFADGEDAEGKSSYLVLRYEEGEDEQPEDIYSFRLEEFFEMIALFLSQVYYDEQMVDQTTEDGEGEEYGPVHHLAHLLLHIVDAGKDVEP